MSDRKDYLRICLSNHLESLQFNYMLMASWRDICIRWFLVLSWSHYLISKNLLRFYILDLVLSDLYPISVMTFLRWYLNNSGINTSQHHMTIVIENLLTEIYVTVFVIRLWWIEVKLSILTLLYSAVSNISLVGHNARIYGTRVLVVYMLCFLVKLTWKIQTLFSLHLCQSWSHLKGSESFII